VAGGPLGTGVAGGVSMLFGDQLSDREIFAAIQANGTVKDIGGALQYYNMRNRWNYGGGIEHVPYVTEEIYISADSTVPGCINNPNCYDVNQLLERIYIDQASTFTQYPFSSTRRLELSASVTHYGFDIQNYKTVFLGDEAVDQEVDNLASPYQPVWLLEPSVALVGDNSYSAFTSPVDGERYRLQVTPTFGSAVYQTVVADYRRYLFYRPFTVAFRGVSLGRYGSGAENINSTFPFNLGDETLMRGYGYGSFTNDECVVSGANANSLAAQAGGCPVLQRLFGSKVAVVNAEIRIPLFGTEGFGLFNFPFLPTEMAPFFDAGVSYTNEQLPDFRFATSANEIPNKCANPTTDAQAQQLAYYPCADRIPVMSTGVSFRFNLLGYAIMEAYLAHPFQRPTKNWVWGFQLAPGW
jgi:hypothetical protein